MPPLRVSRVWVWFRPLQSGHSIRRTCLGDTPAPPRLQCPQVGARAGWAGRLLHPLLAQGPGDVWAASLVAEDRGWLCRAFLPLYP